MGKKVVLILIGIGLLLVLVLTQGGGTGARLSDTEVSSGNIISGWTPYQADDLSVDTSNIVIVLWGRCLSGVKIENGGQYDITIDKVKLSWEPDGGQNVRLVQIWPHDWIEWLGIARSGTELDTYDCTLEPGDKYFMAFCFDSDMHGKEFTLEFIMGDGSSKTVTFETNLGLQTLEASGLGEEHSGGEDCCQNCTPGEIVLTPDSATITVGEAQSYTAEAFDHLGNSLGDVTAITTFDIDAEAGGSWAGNEYTSEEAGVWTVTGTCDGPSATASLTVNSASEVAEIGYSPTSFIFEAEEGGANPDDQTLDISNSGAGTLDWSVSDDATWLSLSPTSGIDTGTVTLSVDISGMSAGEYDADITITASGATNTPVTVPVHLTITAPLP